MTTREIIPNNSKIIMRDMREMRAARTISDRPNSRGGGFKSFVDFDVTMVCHLDSGRIKADAIGIRGAARSDQKMCSFQNYFGFRLDHMQLNRRS